MDADKFQKVSDFVADLYNRNQADKAVGVAMGAVLAGDLTEEQRRALLEDVTCASLGNALDTQMKDQQIGAHFKALAELSPADLEVMQEAAAAIIKKFADQGAPANGTTH